MKAPQLEKCSLLNFIGNFLKIQDGRQYVLIYDQGVILDIDSAEECGKILRILKYSRISDESSRRYQIFINVTHHLDYNWQERYN